jgi:WD40 repeat protein
MWFGSVKKGAIVDLAYSPDAQKLYSLDSTGQVSALRLADRKATPLFRGDVPTYPDECPPLLAVSPDGCYLLATGDEQIAVWDLTTGEHREPVDCNDGAITFPCFVNGGRSLYTVGTAAHWLIHWSWPDLEELDKPEKLAELTEFPGGAAADPTGARLAVFAHGAVVWDIAKNRLLGTVEFAAGADDPTVAFAPGGKVFVLGQGKMLRVCLFGRKKSEHTIEADTKVLRVACHPGGRLFASAGAGPVVAFWDVESGKRVADFELPLKKVQSLAFSPDGCTCAAGGAGKLAVWDVDGG